MTRQGLGAADHLIPGLPWESQDHVGAEEDATAPCPLHRIGPALQVVPPVDPRKTSVISRFEPVLQSYEMSSRQLLKPGNLCFIDAVGPRTYRESYYIRMLKGGFVERNQGFKRAIGVAEGLEVDNEFLRTIPAFEEIDSFRYLFAHRLAAAGGFRPE